MNIYPPIYPTGQSLASLVSELSSKSRTPDSACEPAPYSIPVGIRLPLDFLNPVSAFLQLQAQGRQPTFLLEGAAGHEQVGRYSYIGLDPFARLAITADKGLDWQRLDGQPSRMPPGVDAAANPMTAVGDILAAFSSQPVPLAKSGFPPFQGGAVGYVGFDAIRHLEDIQLPNTEEEEGLEGGGEQNELLLLFYHNIVAFDLYSHRLYVITHIPVAEARADLDAAYASARDYLTTLADHLLAPQPLPRLLTVPFDDPNIKTAAQYEGIIGAEAFYDKLATIKEHILDGDIFQCVLSEQFRFDLDVEPFVVYRVLRMINPSPYLFYFRDSAEDETLLGASPEMLVRVQDGQIETCPIAGTRPRGKTPDEDERLAKELLADEKELAEHLMLVDLSRNDLGRTCAPGTVAVRDFMAIERYSHVMHITSKVTGSLAEGMTPWQAFCASFPAGTLSGAPKVRALEILSALEPVRRGPYGGAVVYYDFAGNLNSCITIRSLHVRGGKAKVQAGAGIVADSQPKLEYEEVQHKASGILKAVGLAEKVRLSEPGQVPSHGHKEGDA